MYPMMQICTSANESTNRLKSTCPTRASTRQTLYFSRPRTISHSPVQPAASAIRKMPPNRDGFQNSCGAPTEPTATALTGHGNTRSRPSQKSAERAAQTRRAQKK